MYKEEYQGEIKSYSWRHIAQKMKLRFKSDRGILWLIPVEVSIRFPDFFTQDKL